MYQYIYSSAIYHHYYLVSYVVRLYLLLSVLLYFCIPVPVPGNAEYYYRTVQNHQHVNIRRKKVLIQKVVPGCRDHTGNPDTESRNCKVS